MPAFKPRATNVYCFVNFYPRDAMLSRHLLSSRVRLSVRLTQDGIVSKRSNIRSQK